MTTPSAASDLLRLPDGRQLQFWEGGARDGRPVVFFPGCPDSRHVAFSAGPVAERDGVRLIAVNRPGYGASTATASDHLSVSDDVIALADHLELTQFATLGMSLGGPYALACATRHPGRVRAVGVVASPAPPTALDPPLHRDHMSAEEQQFFSRLRRVDIDAAAEMLRPDYADWVAAIAPSDADDDALASRWLAAMSAEDRQTLSRFPTTVVAAAAREALAQLDGYLRDVAVTFRDWAFRPDEINAPVWLCYGADDGNVSLRNADWLAAQIRQANVEVLPGTTHLQALLDNWQRAFTALTTG